MPDPAQLAAQLHALADQVATLANPPAEPGGPDEPPAPAPAETPPGKPARPDATLTPDSVILTWPDAGDAAHWEVRDELDPDPATRVKDVVTEPRSVRSPMRSTSRPRRYVLVAVGAGGLRSEPSDPLDLPPVATPSAPATPGVPATPGGRLYPSDILDLRTWTVMLPTGTQGRPDNGYMIDKDVAGVFYVRDGAVMFRANAGGVHSPNSKFARCEAREMTDSRWTKAAWPSTGPRSLEVDLAIDASGLVARKRINGVQIHDGADDVCQVMRHESRGLGLAHDDGRSWEPIDPGYVDGTRFTCKVTVAGDRIRVFYNGRQVVDIPKKGTGWYWKMGCYLQTDVPTYHEAPDATGEVVIWRYTLDS